MIKYELKKVNRDSFLCRESSESKCWLLHLARAKQTNRNSLTYLPTCSNAIACAWFFFSSAYIYICYSLCLWTNAYCWNLVVFRFKSTTNTYFLSLFLCCYFIFPDTQSHVYIYFRWRSVRVCLRLFVCLCNMAQIH